MPPTLRFTLAGLCALFALTPPRGVAADSARVPGDPVVEMPAFVITETKTSGRPWRYAETEGFEIISQVADDSTQEVFAALWRGPRLTLPPELWPRLSTPMAVVIFDQEPDRAGGIGSLGSIRQSHEQSSHWTNVIKRTLPDREIFCVNLSGSSFTYSSTFRFDLRTLLALHTPPAPPWLLEALYGSYGLYREGIEYPDHGKATGVVPALWCTESELFHAESLTGAASEHFLTAPEKRRGANDGLAPLRAAVAPLAGLWNGGLPGDRRSVAENARWAATCALFARWALYAQEGKRHDAFWRFAVQTAAKPVDEALFKECLGLGFEEATNEVAWFLPVAISEQATRPIAPLVVPKIKLRYATTAEVARLRGDWERGEAAQLAGRFPEIAAKYSAQAGRTLRSAHATDPGDARLTEVLALYEFDAGNNTRALELLSAATATGRGRPRAWFTQAHLRLMENNANGGGPRAPLTLDQARQILLPLEQAWPQEPAMTASYELLAEVWRRCPELPANEALARLREGVARFPRNPRVAMAAIRACVERGERAGAVAIIAAALPFTDDPAAHDGLEKMHRALLRATTPAEIPTPAR